MISCWGVITSWWSVCSLPLSLSHTHRFVVRTHRPSDFVYMKTKSFHPHYPIITAVMSELNRDMWMSFVSSLITMCCSAIISWVSHTESKFLTVIKIIHQPKVFNKMLSLTHFPKSKKTFLFHTLQNAALMCNTVEAKNFLNTFKQNGGNLHPFLQW